MSDFDAYYKWLGIPPDEQPPTYYRLLGLRDMMANSYHQLRDKRLVGVETDSPTVFHKIETIEISGRGRPAR